MRSLLAPAAGKIPAVHEARVVALDAGDGVPDDAALAGRASSGDVAAFEILYRRHHRRVYALCLRLTGNAAQAEEHVQETFVKAWEHLSGFRGDSAFGTWLYRIATNAVLGSFRTRARHGQHVRAVDDEFLAELPAVERPVGTELDLERAIQSLPPGARTVFVLHDVEGWRHDEIAERTGLAVGTCKAQLHRARRLLRERLTS